MTKKKIAVSFFGYIDQFNKIVEGRAVATIIGYSPDQDFPNKTKLEVIGRPRGLSVSKISKKF